MANIINKVSPLLFLLAVMVAVVGRVASILNHDYLLVIVVRMMVIMVILMRMMRMMVMMLVMMVAVVGRVASSFES